MEGEGLLPQSVVLAQDNPVPVLYYLYFIGSRSSSTSSVRMSSSTGCSDKLLSFGTGFKSYYDDEDEKSKQKHEAGVLLVWESDHWRSCPNPKSTL